MQHRGSFGSAKQKVPALTGEEAENLGGLQAKLTESQTPPVV